MTVKNKHKKLILRELIFGRVTSIFMLVLWLLAWKVLYSIAKVGQLRTNLPYLLGLVFVMLLMVIEIIIKYHKYIKNHDFYDSSLTKPIKKIYMIIIASAFLIITILGVYKVGTCAVNLNGDLAWKINELKTDKKVKLKDDNFYTVKLHGIIQVVDDKIELEPHLMTNSLDIHFEPDGTIKSIETYIYGYDKDYKLKNGYLLYYNKAKHEKLTVHKQDFGTGGSVAYNAENDLSNVIKILDTMPIKEDVNQWNQSEYAVLYKGIRSFGYNLDGIRYIDIRGNVTIPDEAREEIVGPTVSLYCPGKEEVITPYRFVFKVNN